MISTPDKLMTELGYISMYASNFDYLLNEINSSLINLDNYKIGNHISSKLSTHTRIEMYRNLLKMIPFSKELVKTAESNLSAFSKAKVIRNELIHGIWHTKTEDEITLDEFYIGKINTDWNDSKKIDVKELQELKAHLRDLIQKQVQINLDILASYRKIINADVKHKKKISRLLNDAINSDDIED